MPYIYKDKQNLQKYSIILLFLCLSCFMPYIKAQSDSTQKQIGLIVKTDILLPAITLANSHTAEFSLTVEKLFSKRHSIQLSFMSFGNTKPWSYTYVTNQTSVTEKIQYNSIAIIPEYKFFVSKKKNYTGYYIGASAAYIQYVEKGTWSDNIPAGVTYKNTTGPATLSGHSKYIDNGLAVGIINGVQYYVGKHLVLDFVAGGGIYWDVNSGTSFSESTQFIFRLALNVGYRF